MPCGVAPAAGKGAESCRVVFSFSAERVGEDDASAVTDFKDEAGQRDGLAGGWVERGRQHALEDHRC
jgi:hypothetical protein